jgi:glucose/arabinose dehydrogenase
MHPISVNARFWMLQPPPMPGGMRLSVARWEADFFQMPVVGADRKPEPGLDPTRTDSAGKPVPRIASATSMKYIAHLICLASLLVGFESRGDTVSVNVAADTFIFSTSPDANAGATGWIDAGRDGVAGVRRALFRFDLSGVNISGTVTSAVVRLTVTKVPSLGPLDSTFDLFKLKVPWGEGNKGGPNGTNASPGEATWLAAFRGSTAWTVPGAAADAESLPSASTPVGTARTSYTWSGMGLVADVSDWLEHPSRNHGWLLRSRDEASERTVRGFASRESGASFGVLTIGYTPTTGGNLPPAVQIATPTNSEAFTSPANVTITAEASDADGSVTNVQFFNGAVSLGSVSTPPFRVTTTLFAGTYTLSAVASDNLGATSTSSNVVITVGSTAIANPIEPRIPKGDITLELQTVADGMASPLGMAVPDDGSGRMFVYDQDGGVYVVVGNTRLATPLLDVNSRLVQLGAYDERGLLGLAVHPNFSQNPLVYTYTSEPTNGVADFQTGITNNNHHSVMTEWRISASSSNVVDIASRREVMRIEQPQGNHNGGTMRFGPDGLLYVTLGDGGAANDVAPGHVAGGNAQDLTRIWGKVIRIDVDGRNSASGQYGIPTTNPFVGGAGLPEIYAYGVRNPFAFSFDRTNGQLYLGDVGQNRVEEVNVVEKGGNYGWNLREGTFWFDPANGTVVTSPVRPPPDGMIDPIAQYDHDDGFAVIAGYVYRGSAIPALSGRFVFGDWGSIGGPSGRLFYLDTTNGVNELRIGLDDRTLGLWLKGFGEGPDGELYAFGSRWLGPSGNTGRMVKLVPAPGPAAVTSLTPEGGKLAATWTGGTGPVAVQKKTSLLDAAWANVAITNSRSASLMQDAAQGFFRVRDIGHLPAVPFTAFATGAAEHPSNSSPGSAFGIFALDGNTLTFTVAYSGLTGTASGAHIHGPASAAGDSGVLLNLAPYNGGAFGSNGFLSGVVVLTDTQKAHILAGKTYVNFHTAAFPDGEIRGQIAPVNMQATLSGAAEVPAVSSPGSGLGNLLLVGNQLTFNITYRNLSGTATGAHIHGPAASNQGDAPVMVGLDAHNGGAFGTAGSLSGTVTLNPEQLTAVVDGLSYVNIHTANATGGEIRGQILPCVTAVPLTAVLSGLAERPPLTNSATGTGSFSLEGHTLTFNVVYSGLSGPATGAHIHGPINSSTNAPVMVNLAPFNGGAFGASGTLSGSVVLSTPQRNALMGGLTYVNVHTAANGGGEIRGQVAPVSMSAGLNGVNERPAVTTPGTGLGTFALVRDQLALAVAYQSLTGLAQAAHIHGPAGFTGSTNVLVNLAPFNGGAFGASGKLSGVAPLTTDQLLHVIDGLTYINLHTIANGGGEIRGHIMR